MKIDRLFSILIFLLNHKRVTAKELAERFDVSERTIHRDMDTLCSAGIPVTAVPGAGGGFGIIEGYKLDRQLVTSDDLFFILTTLESLGHTFKNKQMALTLEKIKTLISDFQFKSIENRKDELIIDFSAFRIGRHGSSLFQCLEEGIQQRKLMRFSYINSSGIITERCVEPMTVVFKWFSWYLIAYCRLRDDFRLFRLSRIRCPAFTDGRFERRDLNVNGFLNNENAGLKNKVLDIQVKFDPSMSFLIEDYFLNENADIFEDGSFIVKISAPEDEGLYRMLLSFGHRAEILSPPHIREKILQKTEEILKKYKN